MADGELLEKVAQAVAGVEGNGVIMNVILGWVDYKKSNGMARDEMVDIMITSVEAEEIHTAKEILKDFCKDKKAEYIVGKKLKEAVGNRQGNTKTNKEINDILDLIEMMDENGVAPMFIMESRKIDKIPKKKPRNENETVENKMDRLEEMVKAISKRVEDNHGEIKRELLSVKPSYSSMAREIGAMGLNTIAAPSVQGQHAGQVGRPQYVGPVRGQQQPGQGGVQPQGQRGQAGG